MINLVSTFNVADIDYNKETGDLRGKVMRTGLRALFRAFDHLILGSPVVPIILIVIALLSLAT